MGCGGSRADAIEPRYYESWTRETESTWLTNTDSESPQEGGSAEGPGREQGGPRPGLLEDGKLAHPGVSTASATAGMLNAEKRNNCGSQCANPVAHSMGTTTQRQNGFRTTEGRFTLLQDPRPRPSALHTWHKCMFTPVTHRTKTTSSLCNKTVLVQDLFSCIFMIFSY
ncbi:brain and acute leukemia cytoplasmic protein isoform X1 [Prinia subflava]|uniref:brain and acute leukemia cytoplasmic protein isoform X1 n=1 Tax=Prinia subflava TaxID=208062 RepID=UPI002FE36B18